MRAVDMIDILHLPDYTTAAISSAISFLTKGWVEVQSGEAAGLTSLLEVLQVGSGEERRREEEERSRVEVRRWRPLGIFWSQVLRRGHGVTGHGTSRHSHAASAGRVLLCVMVAGS